MRRPPHHCYLRRVHRQQAALAGGGATPPFQASAADDWRRRQLRRKWPLHSARSTAHRRLCPVPIGASVAVQRGASPRPPAPQVHGPRWPTQHRASQDGASALRESEQRWQYHPAQQGEYESSAEHLHEQLARRKAAVGTERYDRQQEGEAERTATLPAPWPHGSGQARHEQTECGAPEPNDCRWRRRCRLVLHAPPSRVSS